jgi:hypothetical protein
MTEATTVEATVAAPVLSLIPSTRATVGAVKTTLAEAATALASGALTLALRENGSKVNGTLVFVEGKLGQPGDVFNARNARNNGAYGVHTVLGTVEYTIDAEGAVALGAVDSVIDVTADTKAALFTVA